MSMTMVLVNAVVHWRVSGVISCSNISIMVDQQPNHIHVILQCRHVKCRLARVTYVHLPTNNIQCTHMYIKAIVMVS